MASNAPTSSDDMRESWLRYVDQPWNQKKNVKILIGGEYVTVENKHPHESKQFTTSNEQPAPQTSHSYNKITKSPPLNSPTPKNYVPAQTLTLTLAP